MKKENADISRRSFLSSGASAAAVSSIIAIPALAAPTVSKPSHPTKRSLPGAMMGNDPVYTDDVQILINKTIPSRQNILGTDYVNIREYSISGTDVTSALNSALTYLSGTAYGGQILIPHGIWTTNGGHDLPNSISIEGVGFNMNPGTYGTEIRLNSGQSNYVFRINATSLRQNFMLKNMMVNCQNNSSATGFLMTGAAGSGSNIYFTRIENVGFYHGAYGIKVDSTSGHLEVILNSFDMVAFLGCRTGFYCNSTNGGYSFTNCYFSVPTSGGGYSTGGTALDCYYMGNINLAHCLFVGNQAATPHVPPTDGSTILKTWGGYNNISFYDCQDENVQYYYQNATNAWPDVPIVLENCIMQGTWKYTASGSVIFDSCRINITDISEDNSAGVRVTDTSSAAVNIYYKGSTNLFWHVLPDPPTTPVTKLEKFVNAYSRVFYESNHVDLPEIKPTTTSQSSYTINKSRGAVTIGSGNSYVVVYNTLISADSLVFAQLRTYDSGGARIREVQTGGGWIQINLTQNAANNISVGFSVQG